MTELVKDNIAKFSYYRDGNMYYELINAQGQKFAIFPISLEDKADIGTATFSAEHKAINLMRYIRKAVKTDALAYYTKQAAAQ